MPFNGSGVFQRVRNWVADAAAGIKIRADNHDAEDDGFAAGLTNCITKDGQTIVTQNIPMNSKRVTGLQDPVNDQDAATKKYTDVKVTTGGKVTGDLEIEKDHPQLILDDTDTAGAEIVFQHVGKTRWIVRMNADAESGSGNTGSNFDIQRYADDGTTMLGTPMLIDRASGRTVVTGDLHVNRSTTEGVIFLGGDGSHYLHWSGTNYTMPNGKLTLGGQGAAGNDAVTWDQLQTKAVPLGFTPVQQGGGYQQQGNKVYIGWDNAKLTAQVDGVFLGPFVFGGSVIQNVRWLHAGASYPPGSQSGVWQDPFPNSVIYLYTTSGGTVIAGFQHKYFQAFTTSWFTVGF